MSFEIAQESYQRLSHALLALENYSTFQEYRFPAEVEEERLLCILFALKTICQKIFAYQPNQEPASYTISAKLKQYFINAPHRQEPSQEAQAEFQKYLAHSPLVQKFVNDPCTEDISELIKHTLHSRVLDAQRNTLLQNKRPPLSPHTRPEEIEQGKVFIAAEQFAHIWQQTLQSNRSDIKNALIKGGYLVLLPEKELIATLTEASLYYELDTQALRAAAELIRTLYPTLEEGMRLKIIHLTTTTGLKFFKEILSPRALRTSNQPFVLTDLFSITDPHQLREALIFFSKNLAHGKNEIFYLTYKQTDIPTEMVDRFDDTIDTLIDLLHQQFLQQKKLAKYELWQEDTFKIIWLLTVIWFRKTYADLRQQYLHATP